MNKVVWRIIRKTFKSFSGNSFFIKGNMAMLKGSHSVFSWHHSIAQSLWNFFFRFAEKYWVMTIPQTYKMVRTSQMVQCWYVPTQCRRWIGVNINTYKIKRGPISSIMNAKYLEEALECTVKVAGWETAVEGIILRFWQCLGISILDFETGTWWALWNEQLNTLRTLIHIYNVK